MGPYASLKLAARQHHYARRVPLLLRPEGRIRTSVCWVERLFHFFAACPAIQCVAINTSASLAASRHVFDHLPPAHFVAGTQTQTLATRFHAYGSCRSRERSKTVGSFKSLWPHPPFGIESRPYTTPPTGDLRTCLPYYHRPLRAAKTLSTLVCWLAASSARIIPCHSGLLSWHRR